MLVAIISTSIFILLLEFLLVYENDKVVFKLVSMYQSSLQNLLYRFREVKTFRYYSIFVFVYDKYYPIMD